MDFSKLKVADLKKELKNRGLSTVGNKNELQERLQIATLETDAVLDPNISDLLDEDVLNDDELDDEDKSLLADETSHIEDESLLSTSSHSTKADGPATTGETSSVVAEKKIVLKRSVPITAPTTATDAAAETEEPAEKSAKLTQLTAAERLELRTKKFGSTAASLPVNTELKKQARAERFGVKTAAAEEPAAKTTATEAKKPAASNKIDTSTLEAVSVEVLKKRAERFGTVSSKLVSVENEERLAKRQGRFGITAPTAAATKVVPSNGAAAVTAPTTTSAAAKDYADRAKQRLERFKQEVK